MTDNNTKTGYLLSEYYWILAHIPEGDYESRVEFLKSELDDHFVRDYHAQFNAIEWIKYYEYNTNPNN